MEWVPDDMWLTFMELDATAGELDYDLALSAHEDALPSLEDAGVDGVGGARSSLPDARVRLVADRCRCGCGRPGRGGRDGRRPPPDSARGIGRRETASWAPSSSALRSSRRPASGTRSPPIPPMRSRCSGPDS